MANTAVLTIAAIACSALAVIGATCPPGVSEVQCFVDPCETHKCPNHPEAICKANNCGGCFAEFYANGRRVDDTCGSTDLEPPQANDDSDLTCPPEQQVRCWVSPCKFARCERYPDARCENNNCGACRAIFYKDNVRVRDCKIEETREERKCPPGEERVNCFVNPCKFARCPNFPKATCVPNYCGACKAEFYSPEGSRIYDTDCTIDLDAWRERAAKFFGSWGK